MGRFTRDPELRYTQNQIPVVSFSIACQSDGAVKEGEERKTQFFDCVAWRSTAEFVSKYFFKGRLAVISGELRNRDWTDKDGNKRRSTEILVGKIYFADSKRRDDEGDETDAEAQIEAPAENSSGYTEYTGEEELPF